MYTDIENKLGVKIESKKSFKAGWAGETVSLTFEHESQKYVAKTYTAQNGLQEIRREWAGLNFLYQAHYPVPKPVLSNFEHPKPYILMQQIDGEVFWTVYEQASPQDQRQLLDAFISVFFRLHGLDVSIASAPLLAKESTLGFIEKELTAIAALAAQNGSQNFAPVIAWLHQEKAYIIPEKLSILHRDYHPWNVLVDRQNQLHVIDLVWGIGDYRFDLAWLCALMARSGFQGFSDAAFAQYKALKNSEINNFSYFKVLATTRWLMNVITSLKAEHGSHQVKDITFNDFILPLIKNGLQMIYEITRVEIRM